MPKKSKKRKGLRVHTGDATLYFKYGREYRQDYLQTLFNKLHPQKELFPGLVLETEDGRLVTPVIELALQEITL